MRTQACNVAEAVTEICKNLSKLAVASMSLTPHNTDRAKLGIHNRSLLAGKLNIRGSNSVTTVKR
jgi:hypothetical protein